MKFYHLVYLDHQDLKPSLEKQENQLRNSVNHETWKIITNKQCSTNYTRTYLTCTEIKMTLIPRTVPGMSIIRAYFLNHIFLQSVIHQNLFTAFDLYYIAVLLTA
jgi:hypothetical protein